MWNHDRPDRAVMLLAALYIVVSSLLTSGCGSGGRYGDRPQWPNPPGPYKVEIRVDVDSPRVEGSDGQPIQMYVTTQLKGVEDKPQDGWQFPADGRSYNSELEYKLDPGEYSFQVVVYKDKLDGEVYKSLPYRIVVVEHQGDYKYYYVNL